MRRTVAAASVLASAVTACSLLTSLDGYTGGDEPSDADAQPDTRTPADSGADHTLPADGGFDSAPTRSELYANAVLADKPLAYWRLEETTGTVAKDETKRYDGLYVQAPTFGEVGVAGSRAIKLAKGAKARMQVDDAVFRFTGQKPYSVELWAKPGELKDFQWLASTEGSMVGGRSGWSLLADAEGAIRYEVWRPNGDGGSNQVRGVFMPSTIAAGALHHVVMTYDGAAVVGYVDGARGAPFPTAGMIPDTGFLTWACRGDLSHCLDDWVLDELAVYDTVLASDRVTAHYELGK